MADTVHRRTAATAKDLPDQGPATASFTARPAFQFDSGRSPYRLRIAGVQPAFCKIIFAITVNPKLFIRYWCSWTANCSRRAAWVKALDTFKAGRLGASVAFLWRNPVDRASRKAIPAGLHNAGTGRKIHRS